MPRMALPDDPLLDAVRRAVGAHFSIEREIGRGGMGVVYLARDVRLDRLVALKVLPPHTADAVARERFLREARTAARLAHPHIVPVYRADESDGIAYFAMAYVDGESLADRVRDRGPLPPAEVVRALREVAWALAYAHARGIVHRDVKPENVLLERATGRSTGRALVTDFGIARQADAATRDAPSLTDSGAVLGTLHYMSPEQIAGAPLDGRADLYALGVVAYHALSGRLPFDDVAGPAILFAHATRAAPPLASVAPHVPRALAAIVARCLAKDPAARYATGEALADALADALAEALGDALDDGRDPAVDDAAVSATQASAIWRRAAQLQADALRRIEGPPEPEAAVAPATDPAGYALAHVVAAAREAGISGRYVAMALAELPRGDASVGAHDAPGVNERQATLFLATERRSLSVSYVVDAPPGPTLRALGGVLRGSPYALQLRETVGPHPLDGGVLVFDLPGPVVGAAGAPAAMVNPYWIATHQQLEARQVHATLRAVPGAPGRTEVTLTCDLRPGVRRNVRVAQWLAALFGGGSGTLTGALLAKGAAVGGAAVLGPAAAVALAAAGLGVLGYRRLYTGTLRHAEAELRGALGAVGAAVRSDAVFGPLTAPAGDP